MNTEAEKNLQILNLIQNQSRPLFYVTFKCPGEKSPWKLIRETDPVPVHHGKSLSPHTKGSSW